MVGEEYVPQRGDVVWVNLTSQAGHEQGGRRPALVLSPGAYNDRSGLALLCPLTSRVKGYPFEVSVPPDLPVAGVILADQVKSLDWRAREVRLLCKLPAPAVDQVLQRLGTLLSRSVA